ncbi:luciferin sulfotransferase-like [Phlebotomus argentipes]|uniref:luciferin sulfotransferase-like n=1 Tax=Phlebotomus argentipes TaxID=94469 RepID=UPI002893419E|nr:luciferin sulfotransferase-like [Phlebotomus argentipes]
MNSFCEAIERDEAYEKAKYMTIEDYSRFGSNDRPAIPSASKWTNTGYFFPTYYKRCLERIENFQVRPDDVWVVTFPKCGTTWSQEMVWMLCNNLDYAKGRSIGLNTRFPFFEFGALMPPEANFDTFGMIDKLPSPRFIKSHLPAPLLPKQIWTVKPKIIYVARNAADVVVSFHHHYRNLQDYHGNLSDFLEIFMKDLVLFSPYDTHIMDFWHMRNEKNILFFTYEDMKKNHPAVIEKTAKFLGKSLTENQILELADHLTFDKMSKNESVDLLLEIKDMAENFNIRKVDEDFSFVRKGKVGSFQDEMTPEMIAKFNDWLKKRLNDRKVDPELWKIFFLQERPKI